MQVLTAKRGILILSMTSVLLRSLLRFLGRYDGEPIDSLDRLGQYVSSRSAFVSQKTLYGYLKARMGTRYPSLFADDGYIASVNIAKMHVFAACLSDLSVYAAALSLRNCGQADELRLRVATHCYEKGLEENAAAGGDGFSRQKAREEFASRARLVNWNVAATQDVFTHGQEALLKWAPIVDELKKFDSEYVANSVRFAWLDVRKQLGKRLNADAVQAETLKGGRES